MNKFFSIKSIFLVFALTALSFNFSCFNVSIPDFSFPSEDDSIIVDHHANANPTNNSSAATSNSLIAKHDDPVYATVVGYWYEPNATSFSGVGDWYGEHFRADGIREVIFCVGGTRSVRTSSPYYVLAPTAQEKRYAITAAIYGQPSYYFDPQNKDKLTSYFYGGLDYVRAPSNVDLPCPYLP